MGHSSIKVTYDLYGHLMPGAEAEAAALLDAFLDGGLTDFESTGLQLANHIADYIRDELAN